MEALRENGIFDIKDVNYAIVETTGKVSVLQKYTAQTITPEMLGINGADKKPPLVVISDGTVISSALESNDSISVVTSSMDSVFSICVSEDVI